MPSILVLGGGICGLASAMMLARDGHDVTVLERDPAPVPDSPPEAWESWDRAGVTQFRQPHYLAPAGFGLLASELPELPDELLRAGARHVELLAWMPPWIEDREPRPGDERLQTITARRPVMELAVARAAASEPGVDLRRGVEVSELLTRSLDGVPHVEGVRTAAGDELRADLVVDAMGRRSPLARLLREAGADDLFEHAEDSGFMYYTRYFEGELPQMRSAPITPVGTLTALTLPSDNRTWSVTLIGSAGDQPLKRLRHEDCWTRVVRALPLHAHWLEGDPTSEVLAMAGIIDRVRSLVVDGQPVATGVALLADARMCTNPSVGRGITLGLMHARRLREVVHERLAEGPRAFAEAWEADTAEHVLPWYDETVGADRDRLLEIEALRAGREPTGLDSPTAGLLAAARLDPDMFRAMLEWRGCLALPRDILARPGLAERIAELTDGVAPPPLPGPDREQLLALVG
jgi:2-polyprenyl-6-methoxyphenol hydroxylase-like FAD-dependent oxidoreductase